MKKIKPPELIVEPHPKEYRGYPFITLIMYRKHHILTIIDNSDQQNIYGYVLDYCNAENIDEEILILTAAEWFETNKTKYPLSIEFSKRGLTKNFSKIYKTFNIEYVSRVIGPLPHFPMGTSAIKSIKRRRKKQIQPTIEIIKKS
jgi:hypothetical protein